MGRAIIVENIGAGLYRARLDYDLAKLKGDIEALKLANLNYWKELYAALKTRDALLKDLSSKKEALDAVIKQWTDELLKRTHPPPPVTPPDADENGNNPETGLPYTDEERANSLKNAATDKVNSARAALGLAPMGRSTTLDRVLSSWNDGRVDDSDYDAEKSGYEYLPASMRGSAIDSNGRTFGERLIDSSPGVTVKSAVSYDAYGQQNVDDAVAAMMRDPTATQGLLNPDATQFGADYRYAPGTAETQIWSAAALEPGDVPSGNAAFFADAAGQALKSEVSDTLGSDIANGLDTGADGGSGGGGSGGGDWSEQWAANTEYGMGATITVKIKNSTRYLLAQALNYGVSGDTEPSWSYVGASVVDNTIIWTMLSDLSNSAGGAVEDYYRLIGLTI